MKVESSYWASDGGQVTGDSNSINLLSQAVSPGAGRGAYSATPFAGNLEIRDGNGRTFGEGFALSGSETRECYQPPPPPPPRRPPRPWPSP
jgi:hypothetical protein